MPPIFGSTYDPAIDDYVNWKEANTTYNFNAVHPVTGIVYEVSTTVYADDVGELLRTTTGLEVVHAATATSQRVDQGLAARGMAQNADKAEYSVHLRGEGTKAEMLTLEQPGTLAGKLVQAPRYLGNWLHYEGLLTCTIDKRVAATEESY